MAWLYLLIAGLFEVAWAIGLKYTDGFTRLVPSIWTVASMVVSLAVPRPGAEDAAGRHRLCGLDRDRRGRRRDPWHRPVRGARATRCGSARSALIVAGIVGFKLVS